MEQQDKAGRMLGLAKQWIQSGQSQKDFARRQEIKQATLAYWVKKHKQHQQASKELIAKLYSPH